jgi:hypothetical protein
MTNKHNAVDYYKDLCFKCLERKSVNTYSLYRSSYGSSFDNLYTQLQVCKDCEPEEMSDWFNEEDTGGEQYSYYEHEKDILKFIKSMPIEGRELFWARCSSGASATYMDGQDWIDYELGILSHEKCQEYGYYSPKEKNAYKELFTTCNHPINKIYNDKSKGCYCVFGASGEYGQKVGLNISSQCYKCNNYIKRYEPLKEMSNKEFDQYEAYYIGKINYLRYKDKFEVS